MDIEILKSLTDYGISGVLLILIVWFFLTKGIPMTLQKFEAVVIKFGEIQEKQLEFFKDELSKISANFVEQIKTSHEWHLNHNKKLEDIHNDIKNINKL